MKTLAVRQVALTHFKNYHDARFTFSDRFNLISGRNGLGKTNLLDAIYYLSVGKSYFTPFDQRVVEQGESFFRLEGEVMKDSVMHHVLFKVQPGLTKTVTVDRIEINRISEHVGFIPIVFSAPRDIELVTGSGQARRRYFDHLLCQMDPEYLKALMEYNYLLQMRNAALKNGFTDLRRVVQTYDQQMAPYAQFIFEKRKWLMQVFEDTLQMAYLQLSEGREEVDCAYESQLHEMAYDLLTDRNWDNDRIVQRSNTGIHKDDFSFRIKSMPAKEFGSQGQIKSLIFSMHLAKYNLLRDHQGFTPLLVLDDIFDKLDEFRLSRLIDILSSPGFGQIFISDTNQERLLSHMKTHDYKSLELT